MRRTPYKRMEKYEADLKVNGRVFEEHVFFYCNQVVFYDNDEMVLRRDLTGLKPERIKRLSCVGVHVFKRWVEKGIAKYDREEKAIIFEGTRKKTKLYLKRLDDLLEIRIAEFFQGGID